MCSGLKGIVCLAFVMDFISMTFIQIILRWVTFKQIKKKLCTKFLLTLGKEVGIASNLPISVNKKASD